MGMATIFRHLKIAVAFAALSSMVFTSTGAAQTTDQASTGPFSLSLQTPSAGARIAGNVTFTGAAVDCGRSVAATRVAFYDGDRNGPYIGDAAMDTQRTIGRYCNNSGGSAQIGFTLITNTRQWRDGQHTLTLVAEFPGGGSTSITTDVIVDNYAPRYDLYGPRYYGGYGGGYGGGYYGGGYGGGYYGGAYSTYYPGVCNGYSYYGYQNYYNGGCGSLSPYTLSSCSYYSCGAGIPVPVNPYGSLYGNYGGYGTGCGAYTYFANCGGYYSAYNYPYYNTNYGVYVTGPGYSVGNCAYYYISYTGCGNSYNYGTSYITLNQAGQSVRLAGPITLSGFATCSIGGVSSVTLTDRTGNANIVIGSTAVSGSYSVVWVPTGLGAHVIQVTATGGCGTFSQSFAVSVIP